MLGNGRAISIYHISSDVLESSTSLWSWSLLLLWSLESSTLLTWLSPYHIFFLSCCWGLESFSCFMLQYFLLDDSLSV
jgi:hypothetical protein